MTTRKDKIERRSLMTGMGAAIAGIAVTAAASSAQAQQAAGFQPARHADDAWFDMPGVTHRVFVDTASGRGGSDALRYAANIMNAHKNAYGGADADYAMVICFRHGSTAFGYNDALWAKYGKVFQGMTQVPDPANGDVPVVNPVNIAGSGPFAGTHVDGMAARGVQFAVCATATRGLAGMVARETGQDTDAVFNEIAANLVGNARLVPAGVMAVTRSQEYGYSLLSVG
jgi:intracellular sulfur oxidation DsrE/DsrF family protein